MQDPATGEWHEILAREAPKGWGAIASLAKQVARARRADYGRPIEPQD